MAIRQRARAGMLLGAALLGGAALTAVPGMSTRTCVPLGMADLEAGQAAPGGWLELTGKLLRDDRIIWSAPATRETYVPMVGPDWHAERPIAVFVRAKEERWGHPGQLLAHEEPTVSGIIDFRGLPGQVRELFITRAELQPAENALVLDYEARPGPQFVVGLAGMGMGLVVLILAALYRRSGFRA